MSSSLTAEASVSASVAEQPALTVESYADLTIPDTIKVDDAQLTAFKILAAETKLPPAEAQKFVQLYETMLQAQFKPMQDAWDARQASYRQALAAMPEFQGDQAQRSRTMLAKAIEEFGDPSVREFFAETGDHPGTTRMMLNLVSALLEDEPTASGRPPQPPSGRRHGVQALYPTNGSPPPT